jgi:hypothetical protein
MFRPAQIVGVQEKLLRKNALIAMAVDILAVRKRSW